MKEIRCVVCGKPIIASAVRISKGMYVCGQWREHTLWGMAHPKCFAMAVDAPDIVRAELQREANEFRAETGEESGTHGP